MLNILKLTLLFLYLSAENMINIFQSWIFRWLIFKKLMSFVLSTIHAVFGAAFARLLLILRSAPYWKCSCTRGLCTLSCLVKIRRGSNTCLVAGHWPHPSLSPCSESCFDPCNFSLRSRLLSIEYNALHTDQQEFFDAESFPFLESEV